MLARAEEPRSGIVRPPAQARARRDARGRRSAGVLEACLAGTHRGASRFATMCEPAGQPNERTFGCKRWTMRSTFLTVPNALSASRAVTGLVLIGAPGPGPRAALVVWGALSDFLDGFMARRLRSVSSFGAGLDLVSDGVFFLGALVAFWRGGALSSSWLLTIVVAGGGLQGVAQAIGFLYARPIGSTGHWLSKTLGGGSYAFVIGLALGLPAAWLAPILVALQLAANGRDIVEVALARKRAPAPAPLSR